MSIQIKALSDALAEPLTKAYRVGGFGLAFLLLGGLLLLTASLVPRTEFSIPIALAASVGLILILLPCYFFYVREIRPIARAHEAVRQNAEFIDTIQKTAMSMTESALLIQAVAFMYSSEVKEALEVIREQIRPIPVIGQLADDPLIVGAANYSHTIADFTRNFRSVVEDVRLALTTSDPKHLKSYLQRVNLLQKTMEEMLAAGS